MTDLTREQIEALRAKADAATQGPWDANMNTRHVTAPKSGNNKAICDWETNAPVAEANCLFIAAANPATVLSLISTITQLRARSEAAERERDGATKAVSQQISSADIETIGKAIFPYIEKEHTKEIGLIAWAAAASMAKIIRNRALKRNPTK